MKTNDVVYGSILVSPRGCICVVKGRSSGKWSFPKGHANRGETPFQCAARETLEETGIQIPWQTYRPMRLSVGMYYVLFVDAEYVCCTNDENEIQDIQWLSVDELKQQRVNVDVSAFLKRLSHVTAASESVWRLLDRRLRGEGSSVQSQRCIPSSHGVSQTPYDFTTQDIECSGSQELCGSMLS
jgi:ADP-ribose pyrophosphatase YjhB (NUDIX family)